METVGVSIFGRNARIHNGVFRLGAPFNAMLLPFYLRFRQGRFSAELFEPLPLADPDAPQRLAGYIETAALDNYPDWLVVGTSVDVLVRAGPLDEDISRLARKPSGTRPPETALGGIKYSAGSASRRQ